MPEPTPEDLVREQIGSMALHAVKNKKANLDQILKHLAACDKAIAGLPNLVEASEETLSGLGRGLQRATEEIGSAANDPGLPPHIKERLGSFTELAESFCSLNALYARCILNLAKTQIGFAKILKHQATMALIYVAGDQMGHDAAQLANRMGKGNESIRAFAQAKFPGVFTATPGTGQPFVADPEGGTPPAPAPPQDPDGPTDQPPEFGFQESS